MKKLIILLLLYLNISFCFGKPNITNISFQKEVDIYSLYEVGFQLGTYANPYDPAVIDVWAEFTAPSGRKLRVNGFYYEDYTFEENGGVELAKRNQGGDGWKVRFTPNETGTWTFMVNAKDGKGEQHTTKMTFQCRPKEGALGFISVANTRYLQQEVYTNGAVRYRSFFPVGPNVAWYSSSDYNKFTKPYGIYQYQKYIDALAGNANYMRVWLCRYQYLSLIGGEHTLRDNGKPKVYFDSTLNQKDAAELDFIVSYAAAHGINLMLCTHTYDEFRDDSESLESSKKYGTMPNGWMYNPYHTVLGLERPVEFFTDARARRIEANLLRYIVARWGYATNVESWELWNEVANIYKKANLEGGEAQAILDWHHTMADYVRSVDPHHHIVCTSIGGASEMASIRGSLFSQLDVVQDHFYGNIQKAKSKEQMSHKLLQRSIEGRERYPNKPFFMGEFGLNSSVKGINYTSKDPKGFDLHNSLWSSLFSGSMGPASFWFWHDVENLGFFGIFRPVKVFCDRLPSLSDSFMPMTTGTVMDNDLVFPNGLQTYYLVNVHEDTLLGWCQDVNYSYQSLRRLTDRVGDDGHFVNDGVFDPNGYVYTKNPSRKPLPSIGTNTISIPIDGQPVGTQYVVRWFDAETGLEMTSEATTAKVSRRWFRKRLTFEFPSSVRDLDAFRIRNTYGDAVFMIYKAAH